MFAAFLNIFKIKELRNRLLFTALIIVLVRMAANIPCPGVNPAALKEYLETFKNAQGGGVMSMIDLFSGGALENFAIATLGIMPYITASIIMQLLVPVFPALEKISREGDSGRQKISQYTRYLTVVVCIVQGALAALAMVNPERIGLQASPTPLTTISGPGFILMTLVVLTATTMVFMWLGEQITERGIGNGVSLLITINIIARLPNAVMQLSEMTINGDMRLVHTLLLAVLFCIVTAATVMLTQGTRRIPIQMARKTVGNQVSGGTTYLPLKVNFSGVMPIIFAGAIMMIPAWLFGFMAQRFNIEFFYKLAGTFGYGQTGYMITEGILIMLFCYFWVANQFNPIQISENLKRDGAYVPGIRPGSPTAEFLDLTMSRITFGGAVFLTALALLPMFLASWLKIPFIVAQFFGGTSLLIMVGVVLDTMSQLESHLSMRNYDGFLKSGRLRGRRG